MTPFGGNSVANCADVSGEATFEASGLPIPSDVATYSVRVVDMGTAHPAAGAAGGTVVASASGLSFINASDAGVSALGVDCYAVMSTYGVTGVDPLHALVDNIEIRPAPGLILTIR